MKRNIIDALFDRTNLNNLNDNFTFLFEQIDTIINLPEESEKAIQKVKDFMSSVTSIGTMLVNQGVDFPLVSYKVNNVDSIIAQKVKDSILDIKVYGAKSNKVYQLDSVRDGYKNIEGIQVSSYDIPKNGSIDTTTKQKVISYTTPSTVIDDKNSHIRTMSSEENGVTCVVTIDRPKLASIVNISENENGSSHGAIISASQYIYESTTNIGDMSLLDTDVIVDKKEKEFVVYIPSRKNTFVGIHLLRRTESFTPNTKTSNMDLWAVARVSNYKKEDGILVEKMVHQYGSTNPSDMTQDTMFKEVGAADYTGGFYHGDEFINSFSIIVGNVDITNSTGIFKGSTAILVQDNNIHHDSFTKGSPDTTAYINVRKSHIFDVENVYTLKQRFKFLEKVTLNFSNFGALSMRRNFEDGKTDNFKNVTNISQAETIDITNGDGELYFVNTNSNEFLVSGYFKDIHMTYNTDSDYIDVWVNNNLTADPKIYSRLVPNNSVVEEGTIYNTSVNYKFIGYQ